MSPQRSQGAGLHDARRSTASGGSKGRSDFSWPGCPPRRRPLGGREGSGVNQGGSLDGRRPRIRRVETQTGSQARHASFQRSSFRQESLAARAVRVGRSVRHRRYPSARASPTRPTESRALRPETPRPRNVDCKSAEATPSTPSLARIHAVSGYNWGLRERCRASSGCARAAARWTSLSNRARTRLQLSRARKKAETSSSSSMHTSCIIG